MNVFDNAIIMIARYGWWNPHNTDPDHRGTCIALAVDEAKGQGKGIGQAEGTEVERLCGLLVQSMENHGIDVPGLWRKESEYEYPNFWRLMAWNDLGSTTREDVEAALRQAALDFPKEGV